MYFVPVLFATLMLLVFLCELAFEKNDIIPEILNNLVIALSGCSFICSLIRHDFVYGEFVLQFGEFEWNSGVLCKTEKLSQRRFTRCYF